MKRKVIIRGHIFDYEQKAPFVASGVSVLGAIEYDGKNDLLRCHECGAWWEHLGAHLFAHSTKAKAYKVKHGLNQGTGLVNMRISASVKTEMAARLASGEQTPFMRHRGAGQTSIAQERQRSAMSRRAPRNESRNLNAKCKAQLLFRIQTVAAKLGHTPSRSDLTRAGLAQSTICWSFGTTKLGDVMRLAGLTPNESGKRPVKFSDRMPWPEGYFSVSSIALEQRAS